MAKLSLIFPMAGQGARFGYRFKPFLEVRGTSFIQAAFAPFRPWLAPIDKVCFIFTAEQEQAYVCAPAWARLFTDVPHDTAILARRPPVPPRPCAMPGDEGHRRADPGMRLRPCRGCRRPDAATQRPDIACAVPTWDLDGESLAAWSVAAVDEDGRIGAVAEKALPLAGRKFPRRDRLLLFRRRRPGAALHRRGADSTHLRHRLELSARRPPGSVGPGR